MAVVGSVVFICIAGMTVLFVTLFIRPEVNSATPDPSALKNYLGLTLFSTSFVSIGVFANVFAFRAMTREKARGNIQALLATPISPAEIWVGKSLAVFLPGLAFAVVMTMAAFLAVNYVYLVPDVGFIVNPWMMVSSFLSVPLVYLALGLLVHLIGLTGKPATGNVIAQVFLPLVTSLMINLAIRNVPGAASWIFSAILLGVSVAIGVTVLVIRSRLTAERVVLSR